MKVTDEMLMRFLGWPLPKTFAPDCGISFDGRKPDQWNPGGKGWPVGTNLFTADEAKAMLEHVLGEALSENTPRINTVPLIKRLKAQRDECADVLRDLVGTVERHFPMPLGVRDDSPMGRARKALAECPTYEQQLRNVAEGIGMSYEELRSALATHAERPG